MTSRILPSMQWPGVRRISCSCWWAISCRPEWFWWFLHGGLNSTAIRKRWAASSSRPPGMAPCSSARWVRRLLWAHTPCSPRGWAGTMPPKALCSCACWSSEMLSCNSQGPNPLTLIAMGKQRLATASPAAEAVVNLGRKRASGKAQVAVGVALGTVIGAVICFVLHIVLTTVPRPGGWRTSGARNFSKRGFCVQCSVPRQSSSCCRAGAEMCCSRFRRFGLHRERLQALALPGRRRERPGREHEGAHSCIV